jgi:hypothetical protein
VISYLVEESDTDGGGVSNCQCFLFLPAHVGAYTYNKCPPENSSKWYICRCITHFDLESKNWHKIAGNLFLKKSADYCQYPFHHYP